MRSDPYMPIYIPTAEENSFRGRQPDSVSPPAWDEARQRLPSPHWAGHDDAIACWWRTWELVWAHFLTPAPGSGFIAPFIDTAFNGHLFMWDSVFICQFARYAAQIADGQRTLDNLYARQHADGFICREISWVDGFDRFHRHDPVSTGPNLLAWSEWEHWRDRGDRRRLGEVFAPLLAFHRWWRLYRTWPDGTSWSTGWGCGMDNMPRLEPGIHPCFHHGWMAWIDATAQQLLSAQRILAMAQVLGRDGETADLAAEAGQLATIIASTMWNERTDCFADRRRDGSLSDVVHLGAFWTLLTGCVSPERAQRMLALLRDPKHFLRPHALPSLAASHPGYHPEGGYWQGGVWPPTTYMTLRALSGLGEDALAHQLGANHHHNVVEVFRGTGTVWENYAPEKAAPGEPAKGDFTGWGGLSPISVFLEYVLGLRPDVPARRLVWDCRLREEHGVERYPFGADGLLSLRVRGRRTAEEEPRIEASSTVPLLLELRWAGGRRELPLG